MAEDLYINAGSKTEKYRALLPQLKNLLAGEDDLIANLANVSAALKETFHFHRQYKSLLSKELSVLYSYDKNTK